MTLEELLPQLRFLDGVENAVLWKLRKDPSLVESIAETAYQTEDFALCRRKPLTRLAVVTHLLLRKYEDYKARGIPDDVIFDTFRDVSLRANLYFKTNGKAGLSKQDVIWLRHIMNVSLFQIGALQFQPFKMVYLDEQTLGEPYMTFAPAQKERLPSGAPVINCHVPRGADLSPEAVEASFGNARAFFSRHFPDVRYQAFLCYSWLLYPPMLRLLSDTSNIKRFASHFSIIGSCPDSEQAIECLLLSPKKPGHGVGMTSLQKLASESIERFGYACGVMEL